MPLTGEAGSAPVGESSPIRSARGATRDPGVETAGDQARQVEHAVFCTRLRLQVAQEERLEDVGRDEADEPERQHGAVVVLVDMVSMPARHQFVEALVLDCPARVAYVANRRRACQALRQAGHREPFGDLLLEFAVELAPRGINVNCVAPGRIERPGALSAHYRDRPPPQGREGKPEELTAMVRFLCGPQCRYITGQTIHVNGGWYVSIN